MAHASQMVHAIGCSRSGRDHRGEVFRIAIAIVAGLAHNTMVLAFQRLAGELGPPEERPAAFGLLGILRDNAAYRRIAGVLTPECVTERLHRGVFERAQALNAAVNVAWARWLETKALRDENDTLEQMFNKTVKAAKSELILAKVVRTVPAVCTLLTTL